MITVTVEDVFAGPAILLWPLRRGRRKQGATRQDDEA
jgi:hypothetical protein